MIATAAKDFDSKYLCHNETFKELFEVGACHSLQGVHEKTLIDIIYDGNSHYINTEQLFYEFYEEDEVAFKGGSCFMLYAVDIQKKIKYILAHKYPHCCGQVKPYTSSSSFFKF